MPTQEARAHNYQRLSRCGPFHPIAVLMLKRLFCYSLLSLSAGSAWAQTENEAPASPNPVALVLPAPKVAAVLRPRSPRQLFPGLFEAVQLGRVFPDNKTFVDAAPRQAPATILAT